METKINFNSAICTSRSQSERLLALGLKKETADMYYEMMAEGELPRIMPHTSEIDYFQLWDSITPAWSLHRLIEMADTAYLVEGRRDDDNELWMCLDNHESFYNINLYGSLIDCIEWLIKEGYFNKEYLV